MKTNNWTEKNCDVAVITATNICYNGKNPVHEDTLSAFTKSLYRAGSSKLKAI